MKHTRLLRVLCLVLALTAVLSSTAFASAGVGHPEYMTGNETAQLGGIVLTGSSLMEQFPIDEIVEENGDDYVIYNRGYGGYTMTQLMDVLDTAIFDLVPSALFINIGTNDIDRLTDDYTYEDMMDNYRAILTSVQEKLPGCAIYMLAYYPCTPNTGEGQIQRTLEQINTANQYVEALADELSVTFLNINSVLENENGYLKDEYAADSIHLTDDAYRVIYQQLKPYFAECAASESYLNPDAVTATDAEGQTSYSVDLVRDGTAELSITIPSGKTVDVELIYAGMDTTVDFDVTDISDDTVVTAICDILNCQIAGAKAGEATVILSWTAVNTSGSTYTVDQCYCHRYSRRCHSGRFLRRGLCQRRGGRSRQYGSGRHPVLRFFPDGRL